MAGACASTIYHAFCILLLSLSSILNLPPSTYLRRTAAAITTDGLVPFLHRFVSASAFHFSVRKCGTRIGTYFYFLKVPMSQFKSLRLNATSLWISVRLKTHRSFSTNRVSQNLRSSTTQPSLAFHLRAMVPQSRNYRFSLPSFQACPKMHPSEFPFTAGRSQDLRD
jgi:hypothetical protein